MERLNDDALARQLLAQGRITAEQLREAEALKQRLPGSPALVDVLMKMGVVDATPPSGMLRTPPGSGKFGEPQIARGFPSIMSSGGRVLPVESDTSLKRDAPGRILSVASETHAGDMELGPTPTVLAPDDPLRGLFPVEDGVDGQPVLRFGSYQLRGELGRGGMGVVYEAWDCDNRKRLAIKVIAQGARVPKRRLQRFLREADAAMRVQHPGVVSAVDAGCLEGVHYYAMELVEGESLDVRLASAQRPHPLEAARIVAELAEAVQAVHDEGLLHRDLKPSNVLLDRLGHPRLTDFGLARETDDVAPITQSGVMVGTPYYMAPEQVLGERDIDGRADVYALGVLLYELLTGRPPYDGVSPMEIYNKVLTGRPIPPRTLNPELPPALEAIALRALCRHREDRFQSAAEMADDLRLMLAGKPISTPMPSSFGQLAAALTQGPGILVALLGAILTLSLLAVLAALLTGGAGAPEAQTAAWDAFTGAVRDELALAQAELEAARRERSQGDLRAARQRALAARTALDALPEQIAALDPRAPRAFAALYVLAADASVRGRIQGEAPAEALAEELSAGLGDGAWGILDPPVTLASADILGYRRFLATRRVDLAEPEPGDPFLVTEAAPSGDVARLRSEVEAELGRATEDLDEAVRHFRSAMAAMPGAPGLRVEVAARMREADRLDLAESELERSLQSAPELPEAWLEWGRLRRLRREPLEALAAFDRAISCGLAYAEAFFERGLLWLSLGAPEEALLDFEQADRFAPDRVEVVLARVEALMQLGQLDEAELGLGKAELLAESDPRVITARAAMLLSEGRERDAAAAFASALASARPPAVAALGQGWIEEREGQLRAAERSYRRALELLRGEPRDAWRDTLRTRARVALARLLALDGRPFPELEAQLAEVTREALDPLARSPLVERARAAMRGVTEDPTLALRMVEAALTREDAWDARIAKARPKREDPLLAGGSELGFARSRERWRSQLLGWQALLLTQPPSAADRPKDGAAGALWLADSVSRGDPVLSRRAHEAFATSPDEAGAAWREGTQLLDEAWDAPGSPLVARARATLERALYFEPYHIPALISLSQLEVYVAGQGDRGLAILERAVRFDPLSYEAICERGIVTGRDLPTEKLDSWRALNDLARALTLARSGVERAEVREMRGQVLMLNGDGPETWRSVLSETRQGLAELPFDSLSPEQAALERRLRGLRIDAFNELGEAAGARQEEEALAELQARLVARAAELSASARQLMEDEAWGLAQRALQEALEYVPDAGEVVFDLAVCELRRLQLVDACLHFTRACELDPGLTDRFHVKVLELQEMNLVAGYASRVDAMLEGRRPTASASCLRALYVLMLLERGEAEVSRAAEAERAFAEALDMNPEYTVAHIYRGRLRALAGDVVKAIADFQRALELHPEGSVALYYWALALAKSAQGATGDQRRSLLDEAILKLKAAIQRGFPVTRRIGKDLELETLKEHPDYEALLR